MSDPDCCTADIADAIDIAEGWLLNAPNYDLEHRIIPNDELLFLVQRINAAASHHQQGTA